MKTVTLYHGTSADNLAAILAGGFDGASGVQLWNCSGGANYFWDSEKLAESESEQDEDAEHKNQSAFNRAKSNSEMGLVRAKDCRRVVFRLEIPVSFYKEHFTNDNSCRNMSGAVVCAEIVPAKYITEVYQDEESLGWFRPYFGQYLLNNDLAEQIDLSSAELAMIKAVQAAACEIMDEIDSLEMIRVK